MAKILFLAHRVPFPPNKGDKIRAFHFLDHLAAHHEIWLGAGADDLSDLRHIAVLQARCKDVCIVPLSKARRLFNMLGGLLRGLPLSIARFRHPQLESWVRRVLDDVRPDVVFVYSSALAQYVVGRAGPQTRIVVDFVDADAEKWRAYAAGAKGPLRWVYANEFQRLVRFDRAALEAAQAGILISETERELMAGLIPQGADKLVVIPNGVDTDYFKPDGPPPATSHDIVLCGRMDYRPNIDGAVWFANEILPKVRQACPQAVFRVVGAQPTQQVLALRDLPGVEVTGEVADVRPYLAQAAVVVAPLRIARGIQNKVLEGMAAGRPVVATPEALDGIDAVVGRDVLVGADAAAFADAVSAVLLGRAAPDLAANGRLHVINRHQWAAQMVKLDRLAFGQAREASGQITA